MDQIKLLRNAASLELAAKSVKQSTTSTPLEKDDQESIA